MLAHALYSITRNAGLFRDPFSSICKTNASATARPGADWIVYDSGSKAQLTADAESSRTDEIEQAVHTKRSATHTEVGGASLMTLVDADRPVDDDAAAPKQVKSTNNRCCRGRPPTTRSSESRDCRSCDLVVALKSVLNPPGGGGAWASPLIDRNNGVLAHARSLNLCPRGESPARKFWEVARVGDLTAGGNPRGGVGPRLGGGHAAD